MLHCGSSRVLKDKYVEEECWGMTVLNHSKLSIKSTGHMSDLEVTVYVCMFEDVDNRSAY